MRGKVLDLVDAVLDGRKVSSCARVLLERWWVCRGTASVVVFVTAYVRRGIATAACVLCCGAKASVVGLQDEPGAKGKEGCSCASIGTLFRRASCGSLMPKSLFGWRKSRKILVDVGSDYAYKAARKSKDALSSAKQLSRSGHHAVKVPQPAASSY